MFFSPKQSLLSKIKTPPNCRVSKTDTFSFSLKYVLMSGLLTHSLPYQKQNFSIFNCNQIILKTFKKNNRDMLKYLSIKFWKIDKLAKNCL